ncbi:DUF222 domain-containing protein [Agrococcus sp. ProA11]|uniref:HNH endonuclease signature motif containing protein n=1 Tax=Agrococcus chionoecetis TaxID=3153752 RepID=UPI003261D01D
MRGSEQAGATLESARALLEVCRSLALEPNDEVAELLARTAELARIVDAQSVLLAAAVAERSAGPVDGSLCRRLGHRSAKEALASAFGIRGRQATELLTMAARTTASVGVSGGTVPARYPHLAAALQAGELSLAQVQAIVQTLDPVAPRADLEQLAWAERALVDAATDPAAPLVPELILVQARTYAAMLDPDGVLPTAERHRAMRSLRIGQRDDGMWIISMVATPEAGSAIKALLDAYTGPRVHVAFRDDDDGGDGRAQPADEAQAEAEAVDDRTPEQRRHDVLVGLVQAHAASGDAPTVGGDAPVLVISGTIEAWSAYRDGLDNTDRTLRIEHTGDLLPIEAIDRLLCDARLQPVVVNDCHHALALGRSQRLFSRAQRRALATRDGGCRAPGCRMPPAWCEAHHVISWLAGGPTDIANGMLLCSHHHHEVHAGRLRIERSGPTPGSWRVVSVLRPPRRGEARGRNAATPTSTVHATGTSTASGSSGIAADAPRPLAIPVPAVELGRLRRPGPSAARTRGGAASSAVEHRAGVRMRALGRERDARGRRSTRRGPRAVAVDLRLPELVLRR